VRQLRIALGGKKLCDALSETGRVATLGICFDTGSDRIRPLSTPALKEIAAMPGEHADLKLLIEGHTDNVGAAAADRLTVKGPGTIRPVSPDDTPEGRQNNRRVEPMKS
jgi:outer membrane protein OmpA-like peptidoglycan-associated protein